MDGTDEQYPQIILDAIRVYAQYKPKFGQGAKGGGLTLAQFQELYQGDSLIPSGEVVSRDGRRWRCGPPVIHLRLHERRRWYDLAAFFERNSGTLREEINTTLKTLLATETSCWLRRRDEFGCQ